MSGNFAIKGGGVGRLMANAILNFHFDYPHTSLRLPSAHIRYFSSLQELLQSQTFIPKFVTYAYSN